jgi:hypothetical protein
MGWPNRLKRGTAIGWLLELKAIISARPRREVIAVDRRPPLLGSKNRTGAKTSPRPTKVTAVAASAAPRTDFIRNNRHIGRQVEVGMLGAAPKADLILELVRGARFKSIGVARSRCGARVPEIDPLQHHHLCPATRLWRSEGTAALSDPPQHISQLYER